ncbi:PKD domain-containing protein [Bacteroidota bacterium]
MKTKLRHLVIFIFCNIFFFNLSAQSANFSTGLEGPGCAPLNVWLYNYSDTSGLINPTWEWDINGKIFTDWEPPMQTFDPGFYTVVLTLFENGVWYDFWEEDIQAITKINSFSMSAGGEACPSEEVHFWVDAGVPIYFIEWDFGDGLIPQDQNMYDPSHRYYKEGVYDVTLTIDHYCGSDTIVQQVNIGETAKPVVEGWLANGPDFCPSDPVIFEVDSVYTSFLWDFGDGNTSTQVRPSHVYANEKAATYNATITVTNSCGNTGTDTVLVNFITDEPAYADINYWFDREAMGPCPGTPVEFETYGTGNYEWDFGDGSISREQKTINYYTEPGWYYITLTVLNGCGNWDVAEDSINVMFDPYDMPYADFYFEIQDWDWDELQGDTLHVCPGTLVGFRNDSYSFSSSELSYVWDFGDGNNAYSKNASHVYNNFGLEPFAVTLTASNSCGGTATMTRYILVDGSIQPNVTPGIVPDIICDGEMVFFYIDEGMDEGRYTYDIDFGDGTFLNNASTYTDTILQTIANHRYTGSAGTNFDYVFSVTNRCGNSLDEYGTVTITDDPNHKPFYYVSNTASSEGDGRMEDWGVRRDPSDHEFVIQFQWPNWPGNQDNFGVFFWYDGFYPGDVMGPADGYVEFKSSLAWEGDTVHAFIPIDPLAPEMIGFAVGWSCDGTYPQDTEPEVWGMQFDAGYYNPQYSFPLMPGGYTNMNTVGGPVILDMGMTWDGLCNNERLARDYYYQLNEGQYIQLSLDRDYMEYYLDATNDIEGYDYITSLSYGDYFIPNKDTIEFYDWFDCIEMQGRYRYSVNGDSMNLFLISDACSKRVEYLTGSTFIKKADFGMAMMDMSACINDDVIFKVAGGTSWEWHFGDLTPVSLEQYPIHVYTAAGDYDAFVVATNSCGRIDTIYSPVKISTTNVPYSQFWYDGWEFQRLESIQFYYGDDWSDEAGNNSYYWDFGDGTTSTLKDPLHKYDRNGEYLISLTVTNGCGSSTSTQMIYIENAILKCEAKIQIDSIIGRTVYFRDISRGETTKWFWDFGDGFTSSLQDPAYTYDYDGIFFVCLSVYDSLNDCSHQVCRRIEIGTQLCVANFTAKVNATSRKVQFTDLSTNASEWFWDFGDGNFSDLKDPLHLYTEPGWYYVCLSIYDDATDCFAYQCMELQVGEEDPQFCFADFSYFVDEGSNSVIFTDESSDNITNWYWTFGDGTYIQDRNPAKKYLGPGIYEVCLIVFDEITGCAEEICKEIPVSSECNLRADFAFFIDIVSSKATFNDRSGGKATDWFWDFGDGGTSSAKSPVHLYENAGFYLVTLSIWDENTGCSDHMAEFIQIGQPDCRAAFEYKVDATSRNVQFYNQSSSSGETSLEYFWYFDDGTYSDEKDPLHQFGKAGMYFVSLTVVNDLGLCMDYFFEPIQVGTIDCAAKFKYFIDSASNVGYFTPEAIGSASDYLWFFGDGSISTEKEAKHEFTQPGYFTVGLNTYDESSDCMDYFEEVILIGSAGLDCRAGFSYISDPLTKQIKFADRSKGKITEYIWEFGDRSNSTERNPVHSYVEGGYYPVCLTVVNNFGIANTFCDYVQLATSDQERCLADFFYSIDSVSKTVEFVQQSHGNPDGYIWDFGDGTPSTTTPSEKVQHTYTNAEYYLVELSIVNTSTNCKSNRFKLINVAQGNQGLRAAFSYKVDSSNLKADSYPVDFVGVSLGDAGKLRWSFGDESPDDTTTLNPTHEYAAPGIYTACLTVSNPITGDENTSCEQVTTPGYVNNTGEDHRTAWNNMISNYPNPFDHTTYVVYELPEGTSVDLVLFDQTGRLVDILVREDQVEGSYRLEYDGSKLDSGIYTLRLATGQGIYTARMVVR